MQRREFPAFAPNNLYYPREGTSLEIDAFYTLESLLTPGECVPVGAVVTEVALILKRNSTEALPWDSSTGGQL